jgi:protein TonB
MTNVMKQITLLAICLLLAQVGHGQDQFPKFNIVKGDTIYTIVDDHARPVGGMENFYKEIDSLMRYPEVARKNQIEGRVFVSFIVNQDGTFSNIEIIRGVEKSLNDEAIRILGIVKSWIPGKKAGRVVKSKFNLVIVFKLNEEK